MRTRIVYVSLSVCVAALVAAAATSASGQRRGQAAHERHGRFAKVGNAGDESAEAQEKAEQFAEARSAPGVVLPGALDIHLGPDRRLYAATHGRGIWSIPTP
jgi:hypothetical protein